MENFQEVLIPRRREEGIFFNLFDKVLTLMMHGRANQEDIENAIEEIPGLFRGGAENACEAGNFQTYEEELGYFYWSSPVAAGVARKRTLVALEECETFRSCFREPSLKVVSVGAGTGSDLVGLFSAIHEYFEQSEPQSIFHEMELLLMDRNARWEPFFRNIERSLRNPDIDFGHASRLMRNRNITTAFIHVDLRELSDDDERELGNAQIVWMKGIMAIQPNNRHRRSIVNNIVSSMSLGALLVVLDSPSYEEYVIENDSLERIFGTEIDTYDIGLFPGSHSRFHYCRRTNQELSIFRKIEE
ncbi:unnamed protein product [Larinioides sclopetarius]|uniref:Uncharacterized protein n=1 Tax=Larinioides sclopetarius TaxID=280406 RepID=A0AAV1YSI8_9ARAC